MFIFFMGMPGSGKTTEGSRFAEMLDIPFLDLDQLIEKSEKMTISRIFETKGEDYFRKLERKKLESVQYLEEDMVVSLGGGTPCFFDNIRLIREMGVSIYLEAKIEDLIDRLQNKKDRPLLENDLEIRLKTLLENRRAFYKQADYIYPIEKLDLGSLQHKLRNQLKNKS